jgi:hypothetical protein
MKKSINKYCVAVKFPCSWSSNDPEVSWYDVKASSEEAAKKIALRHAQRRLRVIVQSINGEKVDQYFD